MKHSDQGTLHLKAGFEECTLFSSIKSCIQEVCPVCLVKTILQTSLALFWTRSSTKNFLKITQNSGFSVTSPKETNYNLLGRHVADRPYIEERLMVKDIVIFPLQKLGFALNLNKSVNREHRENRVLTGDSRFINHDPVSTREGSLKGLEAVPRTSS